MARKGNTDENYWKEYDGLQNAKHQILAAYLGAWFPILSKWRGRVIYIDCHAGRGRQATGHEGSPILALRTLLDHKTRDQILSNTEVNFIFIEQNEANFRSLETEISKLGTLPKGIKVVPYQEDYDALLRRQIVELQAAKTVIAPSFAFVDPYGFDIPMEVLNQLLSFERTEVFINLMFRYIDMSVNNPAQAENMGSLFGTNEWEGLSEIKDHEERGKAIIDLYSKQLEAKYVTQMNMFAENGTLKYVLLHATNHPLGREKMKEAMWKVNPDGSFSAFERDNPGQIVLIRADPDLAGLENKLWTDFTGRSVNMTMLYTWLDSQLFLKKHLHQVITKLRIEEKITYHPLGRFAFSHNPTIIFPSQRPA